jgi:hypothetical protein
MAVFWKSRLADDSLRFCSAQLQALKALTRSLPLKAFLVEPQGPV